MASKKLMKSFGTYSASDRAYFKTYRKNHVHKGSGYYFHVYGYGGKTVNNVKRASTTTAVSLSSISTSLNTTDTVYPFKSFWNAPQYTQYKVKTIAQAYDYPTDKLTVVKAVIRTREHDRFLCEKNQTHPKLSG